MISREEGFKLVTTWTKNKNLIKHMLCVEVAMRALARELKIRDPKSKISEDIWGIAGLIHDADYEKYPDKHPRVLIEELEKREEPEELVNAIKAHAWGYNNFNVEPKTKMEWSLYCSDELTGLIVAVALIRPEKKLSSVTVDNILSKWNKKDFAKGVKRENIEMCEEKLGIKLPDFIKIVLTSMQEIAEQLGL